MVRCPRARSGRVVRVSFAANVRRQTLRGPPPHVGGYEAMVHRSGAPASAAPAIGLEVVPTPLKTRTVQCATRRLTMHTAPPPILDPDAGHDGVSARPTDLARCGMYLSLVAPLVLLALILLQPG